MLNGIEEPTNRLYEFSHDAGRASWSIESDKFIALISYPQMAGGISDVLSGERLSFQDLREGLGIEHDFYPYTISSRAIFDEEFIEPTIEIDVELSVPIEVEVDEELIIFRGTNGELMSLMTSRPTDDTGMMGPQSEVKVTRDDSLVKVSINLDEEWLQDSSRVFPIQLPIDYSLTPPASMASKVSLMALEDETVLYRDTRPDAATQFHITFFDDQEFRRELEQQDGHPVCSTVPYAVGDTYDLTQADITRYLEGRGYDSRTVWLRFIASKEVPSDKAVWYDVDSPGAADLNEQTAERVGTLNGLPIYRGSFVINVKSPPAHRDGVGEVNAYIEESRKKYLGCNALINAHHVNDLNTKLTVTEGARGLDLIGATVTVVRTEQNLPATLTVINGSRGLQLLAGSVNVSQPEPANELIYDPGFDLSSTWSTYWTTGTYGNAERVGDMTYSHPYAIKGAGNELMTNAVESFSLDFSPLPSNGYSHPYEPSEAWRMGNVANTGIVNGVTCSFRYKHTYLPGFLESVSNYGYIRVDLGFGGLGAGTDTYEAGHLWMGMSTWPSGLPNWLSYLKEPGHTSWIEASFSIDASDLAADNPSTAYLDYVKIYWCGSVLNVDAGNDASTSEVGLGTRITIDNFSVQTQS